MKSFLSCLVVLLILSLHAEDSLAQTSPKVLVNLPALAEKSTKQVETILGKPAHKRMLDKTPRWAPCITDEIWGYKTDWGGVTIFFYEETVVAFQIGYKNNKRPTSFEETILQLGFEAGTSKPTISTDVNSKIGPLEINTITARWQGTLNNIKWEYIEATASGSKRYPIHSKNEKISINHVLAIISDQK